MELVDPLDRLLFGVHTYFDQVGTTREEWDRRFGDFAASHPLLVTEWTETSQPLGGNERRKSPWCEVAPMTRPLEMLYYFEEKEIDGVSPGPSTCPAPSSPTSRARRAP